jgi:hypothetical protein
MPGFTVAQYFQKYQTSMALSVLGGTEAGINLVFVRPDYVVSHPQTYDDSLFMHELLHSLGMDDPSIQLALGVPANVASKAISDKFDQDCFGAKPPKN